MAEFNRNQNGVFGEVKFNGNNNEAENTSFFEGTIVGNTIPTTEENQKENASNVFGSFDTTNTTTNASSVNTTVNSGVNFQPISQDKAITKQGLWSKIRAFLFQEIDLNAPIKVELTPYQQKVEDEINEFLHQEITFKGIANFFKGNK